MAVKGTKELMQQFKQAGDIDPIVKSAVMKQAMVVRGIASSLVQRQSSNHGELAGSIYAKVDQEGHSVIGTVYTNKEHAAYVEFGTGPEGQADHSGISPSVDVVYRQDPWWFPGDKVDPSDAEKYHWPQSSNGEKTFYYTDGQPAMPFMYPALKQYEDKATEGIKNDVAAGLRKKVGGKT